MGTVAQQLGVAASVNLEPLLACQNPGDINARTLSNCLTPHPTGMRLLLAPPSLNDQREITAQQAEEILKALASMAEYVIVDFPCQPTPAVRAGLHCCNFVVLAVELEATCLASAQTMLEGLNSRGVGFWVAPVRQAMPKPHRSPSRARTFSLVCRALRTWSRPC